jgi:hypothetical protein
MHLVEWRLVSNENTVDCCLGTVTWCVSYHYIHLYISSLHMLSSLPLLKMGQSTYTAPHATIGRLW